MIKLEIEIREADYDSLIDRFLPMMIERLRQSDTAVARLISAGMPEAVIKAVLKKLPASAKDQLAADLVNNNKDQIVQFLTELSGQNGLRLDIGGVKATSN
jgi:hypothetical protein